MYNAYKTYKSINVNNIISEFCTISRIIVKIMSIIVVLKIMNCPKSAKNVPGIMKFNEYNSKKIANN